MRLVCGVGINDLKDIPTKDCPYYRVWQSMLTRCYSKSFLQKNPSYKGCSVSTEWLIFSTFKKWMVQQDWVGKQLDKDLLQFGNHIYSPETCIFVSQELNTLLTDRRNHRGAYPLGVYFMKSKNLFKASCGVAGVQMYLGAYNTVEKASKAYISFKKELIRIAALQQVDARLKQALLTIAENYEEIYATNR